LPAFYLDWLGKMTLSYALSEEIIIIDDKPEYENAIESRSEWSPLAEFVISGLKRAEQVEIPQ